MSTITLDDAQSNLRQLLAQLQPSEELLITDHGQPLAHLKKVARTSPGRARPGSARGKIRMSPDFLTLH